MCINRSFEAACCVYIYIGVPIIFILPYLFPGINYGMWATVNYFRHGRGLFFSQRPLTAVLQYKLTLSRYNSRERGGERDREKGGEGVRERDKTARLL
jgi:hypothetical protein